MEIYENNILSSKNTSMTDDIKSSTRGYFLGIALLLSILNVLMLLIGDNSLFVFNIKVVEISKTIFMTLGPLLTFGTYILVPLILFPEIIEEQHFKQVLSFVIISGTIGVLFALALNNRSIYVALVFIGVTGDIRAGTILLVAVLVPLIEEFGKAVPIILLTRIIYLNEKLEERRIINNLRLFIFLGVLSGSIFNLLETYLYTWQQGYIFSSLEENWILVSRQIIIRSLNPLHLFNTMLISIAVLYAFYSTNQKTLDSYHLFPVYLAYGGAVILHGFWNGFAVTATENDIVNFLGAQLPIQNVALLILTQILLIGLFLYLFNIKFIKCEICGEYHSPPYNESVHLEEPFIRTSRFDFLFNRNENEQYRCPNCGTKYAELKCPTCNITNAFTCSNCEYPVPVYESKCWMCGKKIETVFDTIFQFSNDKIGKLSTNFVFILAGAYVPYTIALLFYIQSFDGENLPVTADQILISLLLSGILAISMFITFYWSNMSEKANMGKLIARFVLMTVFIQISITYFTFGVLISYLGQNILSFLIGIIISLLMIFLAVKVLVSDILVIR